jgi:hypothetical protein
MGVYGNPIFWGVLLIAGAIVSTYYYYEIHKRKGHVVTPDILPQIHMETDISGEAEILNLNENSAGGILVRLADNLTAKIYNTFITHEIANLVIKENGTLGRQWSRDNKKLFGLNRYKDVDGNVKLRPIMLPTEINNAPTTLYNDLRQPEIAIVVSELLKSDNKGLGEQLWKYMPWLVALGFLAFLWATA